MITPLRALIVTDSEHDTSLMLEALRWDKYEPEFERVQAASTMIAALIAKQWDIILCDYSMPGFDAIAALHLLRESNLEIPVIIVSGTMAEETAVAVMKLGAADYLLKDRLTRLGPAVGQALEQAESHREKKHMADALKKERDLFESLVETIPDQIYFKDRQSRFTRINNTAARHFGICTREEALGKTDFDFFTEEHAREAYEAEQFIVRTGESVIGFEEKETRPDGRITWVSSTKVPLRDENGEITGLVGISRDITERKRLEEQLRQSQKMEAIGQLSGGVAHDFNNLLTIVKGYIGLLRLKGQISPDIIDSIQQIDQAADRATNLTRQLLMFSRQQGMQLENYNLNGLVANLAKMLRRLLPEDIEMRVECAAVPLMIRADEGMVEQVLLNLMVNARDAMPNGGNLSIATESVELDAGAAKLHLQMQPGAFACLVITDSGQGIPSAIIPRIFDPFFTTKEVGKGTGLGLATVYGIMQQHKGFITVESEVKKGTTFRAYFPRLDSLKASEIANAMPAAVRGGHAGILLVEDELALRQIAQAALESLGYRVFSAPSGLAALQIWQLHRQTIELLLTDLIMPDGVSGRELAVRLREENPRLPIVYMSGYSKAVTGEGLHMNEGINYLSKPFDLTSLAKIVRASLDRGATDAPFAPNRTRSPT
ncbi:MAG: response regulator [Lacunisphaera sp.]